MEKGVVLQEQPVSFIALHVMVFNQCFASCPSDLNLVRDYLQIASYPQ